jgi:hypothetical protein
MRVENYCRLLQQWDEESISLFCYEKFYTQNYNCAA